MKQENTRIDNKSVDVGKCQTIEVAKIIPSKFNSREDVEAIDSDDFKELCESIKSNGLVEPIIVRRDGNGGFEAIAGTRRLRAMKHVGVDTAPTVVRNMTDNDVRIASLIENIHRKGLHDNEKEHSIRAIYQDAGYEDMDLVKSRLLKLTNEKYGQKGSANSSGINTSQEKDQNSKGQGKGGGGTKNPIQVPDAFKELCCRIGYAPVTQYKILRFGIHPDTNKNHVAELDEEKREIVDSSKTLEKIPEMKNEVAKKIKKATKKHAKNIVKQVEHDIQTGAIEKDPTDGEIYFHKEKHENINKRPHTEKTSPRRSRDEIIKLCQPMFKLLTGQNMITNDTDQAIAQVVSKDSKAYMTTLAKAGLGKRELGSLQLCITPLRKAIDVFDDILYEAAEDEDKKDELMKR